LSPFYLVIFDFVSQFKFTQDTGELLYICQLQLNSMKNICKCLPGEFLIRAKPKYSLTQITQKPIPAEFKSHLK